MRVLLVLLVLFCPAWAGVVAQDEDSAVRLAIRQVFDGMRAGDSAAVRQRLAEGATLHRVGERENAPFVTGGSTEGWLNSVGTPREETLDEQVWDIQIQIDGRLATAWMKYAFFFGGEFHHCGVNAMMLFKDIDGWKIFALADTSRNDEATCWRPPNSTGAQPARLSR